MSFEMASKSAQSGRPRENLVWDYFIYDEEKKKSICQVGSEKEGSSCNMEIAESTPQI